jgi:hypothetical protein
VDLDDVSFARVLTATCRVCSFFVPLCSGFNVIDLDCDGLLTTFEIEWFFEEQKQRIQSLSQELITFPDIMCQLIDMVSWKKKTTQHTPNKESMRRLLAELWTHLSRTPCLLLLVYLPLLR